MNKFLGREEKNFGQLVVGFTELVEVQPRNSIYLSKQLLDDPGSKVSKYSEFNMEIQI